MTARPQARRQDGRRSTAGRRVAAGAAAALVTALSLLAGYFVAVSWLVRPNGPGDQDALAGATAAALVGAGLALLAALLTAVPVGLRWLRRWWLAAPAVLLVLAVVRVVHLAAAYPDLPDDYGLAPYGEPGPTSAGCSGWRWIGAVECSSAPVSFGSARE